MTKVNWLRGYYLLLGFIVFAFGFKRFSNLVNPPKSFFPLLDMQQFGLLLVLSVLGISIYCAKNPFGSIGRRLLFILFLLFEIQFNSVGAPTHLYQFWLWSSLALALMPKIHHDENSTHLFWGIRTSVSIILLMYFFSGYWKVFGAIQQMLSGEPHLFSPDGLVYHMYSEVIRAGAKPLLMPFLMENRFINPALSFGVVFIQLAALIGIFKLNWHRQIGIGLLVFHIGTAFILDITYPTNFLLVLWCFIMSPFQNQVYPVVLKDEPS